MDKNTLIFSDDVAQQAFDFLVNEYKDKIHIYIQNHEVSDKYGQFRYFANEDDIKPKIILWCPSIQLKLLVMIHELAHYHHWVRNDSKTLNSYSKGKAEAYAYYIGWCVIKHFKLDTLITKDIWGAHSYFKLYRANYGLKSMNYKDVEKLKKGEDEVHNLLLRANYII